MARAYSVVTLVGDTYRNLGTRLGYDSAESWLEDWARHAEAGNAAMLHSLLHWGCRMPHYGGFGSKEVLCQYLAVADGHSGNSNFRFPDSHYGWGENGCKIRQEISDKAWTELCNKLFSFDDWQVTHGRLSARLVFLLDPDVIDMIIWFFRLDSHELSRNLHIWSSASAYDRKAKNFLRRFLMFAWRSTGHTRISCSDFEEHARGITHVQCEIANSHYRLRLPEIIKLMADYEMLGMLRGEWLNGRTQRILRELAFTPRYVHKGEEANRLVSLAEAYSLAYPNGGSSNVSQYPQAAEILLLYPALIAGLRRKLVSAHEDSLRRQQKRREEEIRRAAAALAAAKEQAAVLGISTD